VNLSHWAVKKLNYFGKEAHILIPLEEEVEKARTLLSLAILLELLITGKSEVSQRASRSPGV
jgi:hypothetical protein